METPHTLDDLLKSVHGEGIALFDNDGAKIPCVLVDQRRFEAMMKECYGKPAAVDTNLNILHDDQGHVFVEIILRFRNSDTEQKFMLYANESLPFFEHLATSGIIAVAPTGSAVSSANIFMVQLPKREAAERALAMIKSYLK